MKVYEIILEAPGDNWTGRSAGGLIVPGGSDADVTNRPANRTPSNSTPARPAPLPDVKDLKVNVRGKVPVVRFTMDGKRYQGTVEEILETLDGEGHAGAKKAIATKGALADAAFSKYRKAITGTRWLGRLLSILGVGAAAWDSWRTASDKLAEVDVFFKEVVYKGGTFDANQEIYKRMTDPIIKDGVIAFSAFVAAEMLQMIVAGQLIKIVRWIRVAQTGLAATGVGVVVAALAFAITEGAQWAVKWAIEKYGSNMVEQLTYDAINGVSNSFDFIPDTNLQTTANLERAAEEIRAKARQDRADQANQALRSLGQSNPAITAPGFSDSEFNQSLDRHFGRSN